MRSRTVPQSFPVSGELFWAHAVDKTQGLLNVLFGYVRRCLFKTSATHQTAIVGSIQNVLFFQFHLMERATARAVKQIQAWFCGARVPLRASVFHYYSSSDRMRRVHATRHLLQLDQRPVTPR